MRLMGKTDRYFHIYHIDAKQPAEREQTEVKIETALENVVRTKAKYDKTGAALKELLKTTKFCFLYLTYEGKYFIIKLLF